MRLTKDLLVRFAKNHVAERLQEKPRPVCIYLTGSLCTDDFLLGGTADIDLIFIHNVQPVMDRELIPVTPDVHLDIWHYDVTLFNQPRELRRDAWIGSFMCENPLVLHDAGHWFEFTQASACALFYRPENCLSRAQPFIDSARQKWIECFSGTHRPGVFTLRTYLRCIEDAANALSCLISVPLSERRMVQQFSKRAQAAGKPSLTDMLIELITSSALNDEKASAWQQTLQETLTQVGKLPNCPIQLSNPRQAYLLHAAKSLVESSPANALWIILRNWTEAAVFLPAASPEVQKWEEMVQELELSPEFYTDRLEMLDHFLEEIEAYFDHFKEQNSLTSD
ncbi:MAG: hypothetical protein ABFD14_12970 [Anaerolineaceae bacterium]